MPHIVKKSYYYLLYSLLCFWAPLLFISGVFSSTPHESENFITSTVTATLSSSATGNTICSGDEIAFTASPDDADQYKFYVNGILKQGPSTFHFENKPGCLHPLFSNYLLHSISANSEKTKGAFSSIYR